MKYLLVGVIILYGFTHCSLKTDPVKSYIPGTYISAWQTQFSNALDTLIIEPKKSKSGELFTITRKTFVNFNPGGRSQEPEYKIRRSVGLYDESNRTVVIENDGSILSFDPSKNLMQRGNTPYRKI